MSNHIPNLVKETAKCYIFKSFEDAGINLPAHAANHRIIKVKCPFCSPSGKSTNGKSLNVSTSEGFAKCHRAGCMLNEKMLRLDVPRNLEYKKEYHVPVIDKNLPLKPEHSTYLISRGIQLDTLQMYGVVSSDYGGSSKITFPYRNGDGTLSFLKYRGTDKSFGMTKSPRLIFFGLDKLDHSLNYVNVFEGEIDALSGAESGLSNCISVPNGAGGSGLEYFDNSIQDILGFEKFILWTDADVAGEVLKAALIQRVGAYRCQLVVYPEGCKDCNEILTTHGKNAILAAFNERFSAPIEGVYGLADRRLYLDDLRKNGRKAGYSINQELGIDIWRAMAGETTFIVGAPNSGKTTIIANTALWLAAEYGLKFLIVSPEDGDVGNYIYKQIQMIANKWYFPYYENTPTEKLITDDEDRFCRDFLEKHFTYLDAANFNSLDDIFNTIQGVNFEKGLFGVILDPFNSLPGAYSLDAAKQNELMASICNRTRQMGVCTIIGAHPNARPRDKNGNYAKIGFNDIQGGPAVANKVDNLLVVNRVTPSGDDEFEEAHTTIEAIKIKLQPLNGETYKENIIYYDGFSKSGFFSAQPNSKCKRQPLFEFIKDGRVFDLGDSLLKEMQQDEVPF